MTDLPQRFRDAMARVPAPVTIITTADAEGTPFGTTVSAFASLSVAPPMVVFALDNRGSLKDRIAANRRVGVNILSGEQASLAVSFARPGDRFGGIDWALEHGVPRLGGAAAFLYCDEVELLPGGDHTVLLGTVREADAVGEQSLSYHLRAFHAVPPAPKL